MARVTGPEGYAIVSAQAAEQDATVAQLRAEIASATSREERALLLSELYVTLVDAAVALDVDYQWDPCYGQWAKSRFARLLFEAIVAGDQLRTAATLTSTPLSRMADLQGYVTRAQEGEAAGLALVACSVAAATPTPARETP